MRSRQKSVRLCCFFCAVISGLLWLLMSRIQFVANAAAQETEAAPQSKKSAGSRYSFRENHDPNGIGKFYLGREIAHVMGYQAAEWLERPEREEEERLTKLVSELKLQPGQVVADIGAGSGVITMMMADVVGDKGKVFAVDIQRPMLALLGDKIQNRGIKNIELVLATEKSPKLKPECIDLALFVDVYHELAFPFETMLELSKSLKPGGRVALVEYRREDPNVPIKLVHKMTVIQIRKEMEQPEFGLKWKETIDSLPRQHIVIFEKPAE